MHTYAVVAIVAGVVIGGLAAGRLARRLTFGFFAGDAAAVGSASLTSFATEGAGEEVVDVFAEDGDDELSDF